MTKTTLTSASDLLHAGLITAAHYDDAARVTAEYPVAVTPAVAELINGDDPQDPVARQYLPDIRELKSAANELTDPIGDARHSPVSGLIHRCPDRVLLKIVNVCPVYCRFCFRRDMIGPGRAARLTTEQLQNAVAYIRAHPEIWEVILTGGDPFVLSPRRIKNLTGLLADIPHVKILRWHTRMPVADPARITPELVLALEPKKPLGATVYVALHANHPREITDAARAACRRLRDGGVHLVSQSVLLRGVNDDVATLEALMRAFVEAGIKPYYLHHPDLARGTAHFRVSLDEGRALMTALRQRLSGLAMPTYVLDIPGGAGKVPVTPDHLERASTSDRSVHYRVRDVAGIAHDYCDLGFDLTAAAEIPNAGQTTPGVAN